MISFNLNFVLSLRLDVLVAWTKLTLFIFKKMTEDYIVVFFKILKIKQTSKINQSFTCKHKINESNVKVSTHYWIVWLYSKYVGFYVFMPNKFLNFFRNMLNNKNLKINNFTLFTKQSNPICANICIFIKVYYIYPILIFLRKLSLESTPLNLGSFS